MTDTQRCRSCGAAIRWAHTANSRAMPLDAEPVADGNVVFTGRTVSNDRGVAAPGGASRVATTDVRRRRTPLPVALRYMPGRQRMAAAVKRTASQRRTPFLRQPPEPKGER